MQLTPRYGTDPIITIDGSPSDILAPVVRQRRRLADALASFTDDQWAHPSRCEGWSNRDVIIHLDSTNNFWAFSIASGLRGEPTMFLATFDPVASPAQMVAATKDLSSADVLERINASTSAFIATLESLIEEDWLVIAEAPPGHISVSALAHHALWDSWVHERDVLLPLGVAPDEEDDEVTAILRYVAALAPAFAVSRGETKTGTLAVDATSPNINFAVQIGDHVAVCPSTDDPDLRVTGDAVELAEALSIRRPLAQSIPAKFNWMVSGLAEIFDASR